MAKCSLCGGDLDRNKRCTFCGLDNTKNDEQYKHLLNKNNCEEEPLTHVHEEPGVRQYTSENREKRWNPRQLEKYAKPIYAKAKKRSEEVSKKQSSKKSVGQIIAIIIALLSILPSFFDVVIESFQEEFVAEVTYETYLEPGLYEVGVHIPEGTYTIEMDWGDWGMVEIQDYQDGVLYMSDYHVLDAEETNMVEDVYLSEDSVLCISSQMMVTAYSSDADPAEMASEVNPLTESFVLSQAGVAGVDFPAGVYDIVYEPINDEEYGTVFYQIMNTQTQELMLENSQIFDAYTGEIAYRNLTLTEGSVIRLEGLEEIMLSPSELVRVTGGL